MTFLFDLQYIFIFWLTLFLLGLIFVPTVFAIFGNFFDKGWGLLKIVAIATISYFVFFFASLKIIPFGPVLIVLSVVTFSFLNLFLLAKKRSFITSIFKNHWKVFIFQEIVFIIALCLWSFVRGHQPNIEGLEKFMDFGFINSAIRSDWLPPSDMWFSGKTINYYWYGHFLTALLIKISGISSAIGYNLMIAGIFALSTNAAFSLSSSLTKTLNTKSKYIVFAGLISAIILVLGGNFHTPIYSILEGSEKYWYPDATRFIGYNPDVDDKTIHEFPQYSFVVSDLHAHLLNLPFVLLFISLLWSLFSKKERGQPENVFIGFLLGIMFMTNAWDYANYAILTAITFGLFLLIKSVNLKTISETIVSGLIIISVSLITALPFLTQFTQIAQGVKATHSHTPFWQLGVLWGFPAIFTVSFVIAFAIKIKNRFLTSDIFVIAMLSTAWVLIFLPEFLYVQDIYISSHYRANTMFKLTYQAFVISYLSAGYITVRCVGLIKNFFARLLLSLFFCFLFGLVLIYPKYSVSSYYGNLKTYKGLDGTAWLKNRYPDLFNSVNWLKANSDKKTVILEAPGDSYTFYNVISSYTGIPTVSGWFVHEWLWRGESKFPQERVNDINIIYTSNDMQKTKSLIEKYEIKYIIVGDFEREKYPKLNENKFLLMGKLVYVSGKTKIFSIE